MFRRFNGNKQLLNHLIYKMKFFRRENFPVQDEVDVDIDEDGDSSDDQGEPPNDQPDTNRCHVLSTSTAKKNFSISDSILYTSQLIIQFLVPNMPR